MFITHMIWAVKVSSNLFRLHEDKTIVCLVDNTNLKFKVTLKWVKKIKTGISSRSATASGYSY